MYKLVLVAVAVLHSSRKPRRFDSTTERKTLAHIQLVWNVGDCAWSRSCGSGASTLQSAASLSIFFTCFFTSTIWTYVVCKVPNN